MVLLLFLLLAFSSCQLTDHSEKPTEVTTDAVQFPTSGYTDVDPDDLPAFTFDSTALDMGHVVQGTKVNKRYTFTNTGGSALVITDVRGSCGCTVGKEWPRRPVPPGEGGFIEVTFDSEGRSGHQTKTVTVVANTTPPSTVLTLTGDVIGPATAPPAE